MIAVYVGNLDQMTGVSECSFIIDGGFRSKVKCKLYIV